jgi:hypothetical protein
MIGIVLWLVDRLVDLIFLIPFLAPYNPRSPRRRIRAYFGRRNVRLDLVAADAAGQAPLPDDAGPQELAALCAWLLASRPFGEAVPEATRRAQARPQLYDETFLHTLAQTARNFRAARWTEQSRQLAQLGHSLAHTIAGSEAAEEFTTILNQAAAHDRDRYRPISYR